MSPALRLLVRFVLAAGLAAGLLVPSGATVRAQTGPPEPRAWILVDGGSGATLAGKDIHTPLPPASAAMLMTALTAVQRMPVEPLDPNLTNQVLVSEAATKVPQPRLRIGQGSKWPVRPLLNAMLMVSAHDAAYALAENASGSIQAFTNDMNVLGRTLGLRDSTWTDPTGDDDNAATPNATSAWDLAVLARAVLAVPELSGVVKDRSETVNGPQLGKNLANTNDLLARYEGASGVKQASSNKAGGVIVASASRNGRTTVFVALNASDPVGFAITKLDQGFGTNPDMVKRSDRLPAVHAGSAQGRLEAIVNLPPVLGRPDLAPGAWGTRGKSYTAAPPTTPPQRRQEHRTSGGQSVFTLVNTLIVVLLSGLVVAIVLRRRAVAQQQRRRIVGQRTLAEARRRGTLDFIDPDQVAGTTHVRIFRPDEQPGPRSGTR